LNYPCELYNKENFKKKLYLDAVVDIVEEAFKALNVHKSETVEYAADTCLRIKALA